MRKPYFMQVNRRLALFGLITFPLSPHMFAQQVSRTHKLLTQARAQIGVTKLYDPAYVRLSYPGGDVPRERGVCIDVIIRAYRDAFAFDFQQSIHVDMAANFNVYPKTWGLRRTDRNIDHRRVPNMEKWLARHGHEIDNHDWQPGDILTCRIGGNLPHMGLISDRKGSDGRFKAIHNIGLGTLEDDRIWSYGQQRRFRFLPAAT